MLLLFAGGVMNLAVILALTAWVAIEKLAPFGRQSARVGGGAAARRRRVDVAPLSSGRGGGVAVVPVEFVEDPVGLVVVRLTSPAFA